MNTLFKPTSYKKGAAMAVGATFIWKAVSFANALLLALYFGADQQTDIYFYLISLIGFGTAFCQNLFQTVLIPEAMFLTQENEAKSRQFITMWLYILVVVGIVTCVLGAGWPEQIAETFSRFDKPLLRQHKQMLVAGFLFFSLQSIALYLTAVTEMYKFFKTTWLGVLNALFPLILLLLLGSRIGIISMVYGFIAANVVQIVILLVLLKTQLHWSFAPTWVPVRVQTRQNMLTGQTIALVALFTNWLPLYLMSSWNAGIVSALAYCQQFTGSASEILLNRTANVAKIEMTEQIAQQQYPKANQTFLSMTYILAVIVAPLVVFSFYFAPQIVHLFLERGQFDAQAAHDTVSFLRPMLFVLLLSVIGYLQNSAIAAARKIKEWFPYALTSTGALIGLILVAIPHYGPFSYPYLLGMGYLVGFVLNRFLFHQHFPFIDYTYPFWQLLRLTGLACLSLVPAGLLAVQLPAVCWLQILMCGCVFVAVYILLLRRTKDLQKLRELVRNSF